MGVIRRLVVPIVLLAALFAPARVLAAPAEKDQIVFGGSFTLEDGETIDGSLLVMGGSVDIDAGAVVAGNVTQLGGNVQIDGRVEGDVNQIGGNLELASNAEIMGDVQSTGGSIDRAEGARVDGGVRATFSDNPGSGQPETNPVARFVLDSFWNLFRITATAALAVVITLLWPQRLRVVSDAIAANPVMAGGVGLLLTGVSIPVLLIAAVTILLLPVTLLGFVILAAGTVFGWSALSLAVGERISEGARQAWSPGLSTGVGALLLGLIFVGVDQIPCIGWAMQWTVAMIALGAVVMTRVGEISETEG